MKDPQPFRPAFDRARWALPGTISTSVACASHVRERARAIQDGSLLAQASNSPSAMLLWREIATAYQEAIPGIGTLGLREAVYDPSSKIAGHLKVGVTEESQDVKVTVHTIGDPTTLKSKVFSRDNQKSYVDPSLNHFAQVAVVIQCSLAAARDWHRHRTLFPWSLDVVKKDGLLVIDHHYAPLTDFSKEKLGMLVARTTALYDSFVAVGDQYSAMLCLPLGTRVRLSGSAGMRDFVYTFELRAHAHGANFEYKLQAEEALEQFDEQVYDIDDSGQWARILGRSSQ